MVKVLPERKFDHSHMSFTTMGATQGKKPFRFYNYWGSHDQFQATVEEAWKEEIEGCRIMFQVVQKMKRLKLGLKGLDSRSQDQIQAEAARAKKVLLDIQTQMHNHPMNKDLVHQEKEAANNYYKAWKAYKTIATKG